MICVPISGPAHIICDNRTVVKNNLFPESALQREHCSIAYHKICETVTAGKCLAYYERSTFNLANLLTKVMALNKRESLIHVLLPGG